MNAQTIIHPAGCSCHRCEPPGPADRHPHRRSWALLAGIASGLAITALIDLATGGPGILAAFGI